MGQAEFLEFANVGFEFGGREVEVLCEIEGASGEVVGDEVGSLSGPGAVGAAGVECI